VDATVQASLYGGRLSPFLKVALSDDLGQGTTLSFGGVTTRQDIQSAVLDTSIGVDVRLASNISGYARGAIRTGIESDLDGYQGDFGIRLSW
jgi:outer membrane autotransporter protein